MRLPFAAALIAAALVWAAVPISPSRAQGLEEIRIEGTQRIEPATVRSYMGVRVGEPLTNEVMDRSLKNLFATGLFADVTIRREGDAMVVRVVENPIINRIAFEGNKRIEDEDLNAEVQLRPRVVYTRTKVQTDVRRILEIYRRSGRFAVTVEPKVIQLEQNRVDLVFEINEGPLTGINKITFIGNREFSDSTLRGVIQTKESRWYRFLSTSDRYDPDRLTFDRDQLRRFYLSEGYADFRVVSAVAELTPDREAFFITFTLEEGERYRFGEIDVTSGLRDLETTDLTELVTTEQGEWYDAGEIETTIDALTDVVGSLGYAFVDIRPRVRRDREERSVAVTFDIQEGPRVYVERIDIVGNVRTEDKVIRREFRLVEGDAFNTSKLRRSRQRIRNLGFFEKAEITNVPGSAPDKTVIVVEVEEQSTGEITIGAGFSTDAGPLADFSVRERNLLGKGQDMTVGLTLAGERQEAQFSFTEPYFLDRNLSAGIDLFAITRDLQDESSFDSEEIGGGLRTGYRITENLSQTLNYVLRRDEITEVPIDASRFIREQEGSAVTSLVGQELTYDVRDNRFEPTEGYFVSLGNQFAGLGGDVKYLRNRLRGGYFYSLWPQVVLGLSGEAGYIFGIGDEDVRINDRFFVGGSNLRGFETAGIGPRDDFTDDSLGGKRFYTGTIEVTFPLGLPEELGLTAAAFSDFGSLWETDEENEPGLVDEDSLRASIGIGFGWRSPFGPIRIDFAEAILKEDFDRTEIIRFSFGTRF